jgi:hypothetical protein
MEQPRPEYYEEDEITLKELILKLQEFWKEIWKNKFLVIAVSGLFAIIMLAKAWVAPVTYPAKLTFMVNEDEGGGGMGGVASVLGQFGFGGGSSGQYNLDKLLELSRSRKIISMVLFEKIAMDGKQDYIANHIIDLYDFHENWEEDTTGLHGYYFIHDDTDAFARFENSALKSVYAKVVGNAESKIEGIVGSGYEEDTGILHLFSNSLSEELSIAITKILYEKLSKFYIEKTIAKQEQTYQIFKLKVDSIQAVLNSAQYNLLKFDDTNRMLTLQQYSFKKLQLQQEVQKMIMAYGEVYKNLALSEFALKSKTPFITTIDEPIGPITGERESKIKAIVIGGFVGGFLIILFLIGRKIFRDTMTDKKQII